MIKNISSYKLTSDFELKTTETPVISSNTFNIDNVNYKNFRYAANGTSANSAYRTYLTPGCYIGFSDTSFGSSTTGAATLPSNLVQDDVVFLFVGSDGSLPADIATWTTVASNATGTAFGKVYYKVMGVTPDTSATIANLSIASMSIAVAFRGIDVSSLTSQSVVGGLTSVPDSPSISVTHPSSLIITASFLDDTSTILDTVVRAPDGYTLIDAKSASTAGMTGMVAYTIARDPGEYDPGAFDVTGDTDESFSVSIQVPGAIAGTILNLSQPSSDIHLSTHVVTSGSSNSTFGGLSFVNSNVYIANSSTIDSNTFIANNSSFIMSLVTGNYGNSWIVTDVYAL